MRTNFGGSLGVFFAVDTPERLRQLVRSRLPDVVALAITIAAGLAVRALLTGWWAKYLGVGLWAVAAYWAILVVAPRLSPARTSLIALAISWAVELAQLTPIPRTLSSWHPLLRLVFGEVFNPTDLIALAAGVLAALLVHTLARSRSSSPAP